MDGLVKPLLNHHSVFLADGHWLLRSELIDDILMLDSVVVLYHMFNLSGEEAVETGAFS